MIARVVATISAALMVLVVGYLLYTVLIANPRVERELIDNPDGARARRVMLLTLPSGRSIPVNYIHEGDTVFAAADGSWWRDLVGDGLPVRLLVRGERLRGSARAVLNDPVYTAEVFSRLRPNAVEGFGTLIEVKLEAQGGK